MEVVTYKKFYNTESAEELLSNDYDYVVDAIDIVSSKIDLIIRCNEMGIPIISSMGAGNKLDPTGFEVTDIYKTSVCPLAKVMRHELRKRGVKKLKVVYSKEEPIKLDENYGAAYYYKSQSLIRNEKDKEALVVIDRAIELCLQKIDRFYDLKGSIRMGENNFEDALLQFIKAIENNPSSSEYYYSAGNALNDLKRYGEAVDYFKKSADIDPDQVNCYINISYSLYNIEKFEECIEYCNRAIELDENDVTSHQNEGWAYYRLGNLEKAEEEYSIALKLDGNNIDVLSLKLNILKNKNLYKDALLVCDRILEINPDYSNVKKVKEEFLQKTDSKKGFLKSLFK
jgi:tetratricopeptide (TPR) repeat protein